jgi:glycosyltransferase involved in cell wall biosynthesis
LVLTLDSPSLEEDLARPERLAATRHLIERAAIVTVQSESARRLFERVFPAAPNPPHVVLPRAHLPERRPDGQVATVRLKDVPPQATLALVLSAPRPRLDPIPLIEAVSALKSRGASIHLAFAGAPRDAHLDVMLTASSSLYRYVHRLGRVPRGGMKTLIERADLVLCPSEGDSYPQALIEAMASGRAIIARERTPTTELCRDGKEAVLYHDAEGLLTALERLHEDAAARATLGAAAAARYAEGGSAADEAARYHALYKAALEAAPGET